MNWNAGMTVTLHAGSINSLQSDPSFGSYFFLHTLNKVSSVT